MSPTDDEASAGAARRRRRWWVIAAVTTGLLSACSGSGGEPISMVRSVSEVREDEVCVEDLGCYSADRFWPGVVEGDCVEVVLVPEQNMPRIGRADCG